MEMMGYKTTNIDRVAKEEVKINNNALRILSTIQLVLLLANTGHGQVPDSIQIFDALKEAGIEVSIPQRIITVKKDKNH